MGDVTDLLDVKHLQGGINRDKAPEPAFGTVPNDGTRYWSRDFAEREWEHMWTKVWLIGGMVNEVPKVGDYITFEIGPESILLVRRVVQNDMLNHEDVPEPESAKGFLHLRP